MKAKVLVRAILVFALLYGCAGSPEVRTVGEPFRGVAPKHLLDAAEEVLSEEFPIDHRDDEAMTIETGETIENIVPGSALDRFRRKAYLEISQGEGGPEIRILVSLERASAETPIFYTGPWEPSWEEIGRDQEKEEAILRQIRAVVRTAEGPRDQPKEDLEPVEEEAPEGGTEPPFKPAPRRERPPRPQEP